jgi:uncharacterized membrane protein
VAAVAALALAGLVVLAPLARAHGFGLVAAGVYGAFSFACHQIPERSFTLAGFPLAVCARCAGLYAGAAAGVLLYPLARPVGRAEAPARAWLVLAALPTTVDFVLGVTGLRANTHLSRFSTACLLGACAALYVVPGVADALRLVRARRAGAKVEVVNQPETLEANSR